MDDTTPRGTAAEALADVDRRLRDALGERYGGCHVIKVTDECAAEIGVVYPGDAGRSFDATKRTALGACYDTLVETGIDFRPIFVDGPAPAADEPPDHQRWCDEQADALRRWQWSAIDWERLAGVVEAAGDRHVGETLGQRRRRATRLAIDAITALRELGIEAWLTGSLARGEFRSDSDIDILVDCPEERSYEAIRAIESALDGFRFSFIPKRRIEPAGLHFYTDGAVTLEQLEARDV